MSAPRSALLALLGLACAASSACAFVAPFPDAAPDPEASPDFHSMAFGDANEQRGTAVASSADAIVLAGHAIGEIDLGGGPLPEQGTIGKPDAFVASFAPDGALQWGRRTSDTIPRGVAIAAGGDVVVAGGAARGNVEDVIVERLSASGELLWSRKFGTGQNQVANAVAVDPAGNTFITGSFSGNLDFGLDISNKLTSVGDSDCFVAVLDPAGEVVWALGFGDPDTKQAGTGVAVDGDGNVFFTLNVVESSGASQGFLAKLEPGDDETELWPLGDAMTSEALGVAADGAGNVFVTGSVRSSSDKSVFVAKLDNNLLPLWSKIFGDAADQQGIGVAADPAGNVLVTGWFLGSMELDTGTLTANGAADGFVVELDPGGSTRWALSFGDARGQAGTAVSADGAGHAWATGHFAGSVDFGGGALQSSGANDAFLVELTP